MSFVGHEACSGPRPVNRTIVSTTLAAASLTLIGVTFTSLAHAQTSAATVQQFQEAARQTADDEDLRLQLQAGGNFGYGNARTLGFNVGATLEYRTNENQLGFEVTYLYAFAQQPLTCAADPFGIGCVGIDPTMMTPGSVRAGGFQDWAESSNNLGWRARWDHFFDLDNAFFVAHRGRRDPFAGLDIRLTLQIGYSRLFVREENHRLWMDVGVDATFDDYSSTVTRQLEVTRPTLPPLQSYSERFVPSVRVFLGYDNHINEMLTYRTGLEVLWNVVNPQHFRFDWQNQIRSRINGFLELSFDLTMRLDAQPPGQSSPWNENAAFVNPMDPAMLRRPGQVTQMFDILTTLNLVGSFDLDGAEEAAVEEAAEEAAAEASEDTSAAATEQATEEAAEEAAEETAEDVPAETTDTAEAAEGEASSTDAPATASETPPATE